MTREELARELEGGGNLVVVMTLGERDHHVKPQVIRAQHFLASHRYRDVRRDPGGIVERQHPGVPLTAGALLESR